MSTSTPSVFQVDISPDHLQAWICLSPSPDPPTLTEEDLLAVLASAKVHVDEATSARIKDFLQAVAQDEWPERFLIAQGEPPCEGTSGEFIPAPVVPEPSDSEPESDRVDYRSLNSIRTVKPDTVIGRIVPPVSSQLGMDVFGGVLKPQTKVGPVELLDNVRLDEDGQTVIATTAGRVWVQDLTVCIRDVLEVPGDVDLGVGNINATSDVSISGTVLDLFEVVSEKSIYIGGAVEAATVEAGECLVVRGGILGRSKGRVRAGTKVTAKFCDEADIQAGQDIEIAKEAVNSRLHSEGRLQLSGATIVGGKAYARQGAEVNTLGSAGGRPTRLSVGVHPTILKKALDMDVAIKKQGQAVNTVRQRIAPFLSNLKQLSVDQRMMIKELNHRADDLEQKQSAQQQARQELLASASPDKPAIILINKRVHANSVVIVDGRETRFQHELKGPIRLEVRLVEHVTELVAVNMLTGSVTPLKSRPMDVAQLEEEPQEEPAAQ